jgi:hypothetical protein
MLYIHHIADILLNALVIQALRAMSYKLPETADEMLQISHVTKANFEKYGECLLKICQQHAADKKGEVMIFVTILYSCQTNSPNICSATLVTELPKISAQLR